MKASLENTSSMDKSSVLASATNSAKEHQNFSTDDTKPIYDFHKPKKWTKVVASIIPKAILESGHHPSKIIPKLIQKPMKIQTTTIPDRQKLRPGALRNRCRRPVAQNCPIGSTFCQLFYATWEIWGGIW